jgi:hypothetical protein
MRVPASALGHLVQCPRCEALFVAQAAAGADLPFAELATDFQAAAESAPRPLPVAVAVPESRPAEEEEAAWVVPLDEEEPAGPPAARPLTLTAWVAIDSGRVLRGRFRGRVTPEGLCLVGAARRGRAGRRRAGESDDLLLPPGTPTRYVGGNRLRVRIDGRRVVLAVSRFGAYHPQLAREVAALLAGEGPPPEPARHRFRWSRLVPAALALGLPLVGWLVGWLTVGLLLAPALALLCLALALVGHWWPAVRTGVSLALAAAAYLLLLAGPPLGGKVFGPPGLPPSAWVEFSSPEGRFAATFPGVPRQRTEKVGQVPNQIELQRFEVRFPDRDVGFYVHYFEAPGLEDKDFVPRIRDTVLKDFPGGVTTAERPVWVNGVVGREFEIAMPPRITIVRRAFLVHGRVYLVSVSGSNLNPSAPDVTRFLGSFRVTDVVVPPVGALPGQPAGPAPEPGVMPPGMQPGIIQGQPPGFPQLPGMPGPGPPAAQGQPRERPPLPAVRAAPPSASSFPGLLAYWPLDRTDGRETPERTGQAGAAVLHGARGVPGIRGQALGFNGHDAYCDCGGSPRLNFAAGAPFTLAGWVQTNEREGTVVSLRNSRSAAPALDVLLMGRRLIAEVRDDVSVRSEPVRLHGAVPINDGAWHHFAVTRDGGNRVGLYVDGWQEEEEAAAQAGGPITTDTRALGCERYWLRHGFFDADAQFLEGDIDEVCVYGRALCPDEIQALASVGPLPPGVVNVPDPAVEPPQAARPAEPPGGGPAPAEPPPPPADAVVLRERVAVRLRPGDAGAPALSPDGKTLALPGGGDVRLIDVAGGAVTATWRVQGSGAYRVAFSPDGKTLAVGCLDCSIRLWDAATGKEQATLKEGFGFVYSLAFTRDGKTLAAGSERVRLWDVVAGNGRALPRPQPGWVTALAFSPDGKVLASGGADKMVRLWDPATEKELATLAGHRGTVLAVAFSPDGKTVASASADRTVKLWEVATRRAPLTLSGHADPLSSVAFSPDGRTLVTGAGAILWSPGHRGEVKLWDAATGRQRAELQGHTDGVSGVAFTPDGRTVLASGADGTVRFWDVSGVATSR